MICKKFILKRNKMEQLLNRSDWNPERMNVKNEYNKSKEDPISFSRKLCIFQFLEEGMILIQFMHNQIGYAPQESINRLQWKEEVINSRIFFDVNDYAGVNNRITYFLVLIQIGYSCSGLLIFLPIYNVNSLITLLLRTWIFLEINEGPT